MPSNLANAGVQWANTWTTFDEAYDTYLRHCNQAIHGIGFVLTQTDPYVAVDIDGCVHEHEINLEAVEVIKTLASYTEILPSGRGLRILLACSEFHDNVRREAIEVYSHSRYVTVTGLHVAGTLPAIVAVSADLIASLLPPAPQPLPSSHIDRATPTQFAINDSEFWERIFTHDKYGADHQRRFQGDTSLDRDDHSFTVIRLLNCLAR